MLVSLNSCVKLMLISRIVSQTNYNLQLNRYKHDNLWWSIAQSSLHLLRDPKVAHY